MPTELRGELGGYGLQILAGSGRRSHAISGCGAVEGRKATDAKSTGSVYATEAVTRDELLSSYVRKPREWTDGDQKTQWGRGKTTIRS